MSIEATVFILDNSDWARNGDYSPNRWESQLMALQLMVEQKMQSNPENSLGLILLGGKQVQLLLTPAENEAQKLIGLTHGVKLGGTPKFAQAISIAQLVLKHRKNKTHRQRIVVMVASPITQDEKDLINLGKKLRKNSIAVDLILMGDMSLELKNKMEAFIKAVNQNNTSSFIPIEQGVEPYSYLFNIIAPLNAGGAGDGGVAPGPGIGGSAPVNVGGGGLNDFGVNYNDDPELAMALRMSLEETQAQNVVQEEAQKEGAMQVQNKPQEAEIKEPEVSDEELLNRALQLSMEDEQIEEEKPLVEQKEEPPQEEANPEDTVLNDPDFISELLDMVDKQEENDGQNNQNDQKDGEGKDQK